MRLFHWGWFLGFLLVDVLLLQNFFGHFDSLRFLPTSGTLVKIGQSGDSESGEPTVNNEYSYTVSGRKYVGTRYYETGWLMLAGDIDSGANYLRNLPSSEFTVFYDPRDPSQSVLQPVPTPGELVLLTFLVPFNLFAMLLPMGWIPWKRAEVMPPFRVRRRSGLIELSLGVAPSANKQQEFQEVLGMMTSPTAFWMSLGLVAPLTAFFLFVLGLSDNWWAFGASWALTLGACGYAAFYVRRFAFPPGNTLVVDPNARELRLWGRTLAFNEVDSVKSDNDSLSLKLHSGDAIALYQGETDEVEDLRRWLNAQVVLK